MVVFDKNNNLDRNGPRLHLASPQWQASYADSPSAKIRRNTPENQNFPLLSNGKPRFFSGRHENFPAVGGDLDRGLKVWARMGLKPWG
jgi:hypothetical protein